MEQMMNQDATMNVDMNAQGAAKKGSGMKYGMIACAVLAVAGIGFGVYEMLQANQAKQQISDLKVEIKNNDGSTTTLETDKIEVKEDTKTVVISESAAVIMPFDPTKSLNLDLTNLKVSQVCHQEWIGFFCLDDERTSIQLSTLDASYAKYIGNENVGGKSYTFTANGKVADFYLGGWGQAAGDETLFFIMDDGTLQYVPIRYAINNSDFAAKPVDGVSNIVKLVMVVSSAKNSIAGGSETVAIKSDGTWYNMSSIIGGRDTVYYAL